MVTSNSSVTTVYNGDIPDIQSHFLLKHLVLVYTTDTRKYF